MDRTRSLSAPILAILLWLASGACASSAPPSPPPPSPSDPAELPIRRIPLAGPPALREAEISGLAWLGDELVLLPQYPDRFPGPDGEGSLFAISRQRLLALVRGADPSPITPRRIAFFAPGVRDSIRGFEGFEAVAFTAGRAYFLIEAAGGDSMTAFLLRGRVDQDGARIAIEPRLCRAIPVQTRIENMSYEAIVALPDRIAVLSEVSGSTQNPRPVALEFDLDLQPVGTVPSPSIEYRVTDATEVDAGGRFWVINFNYPGDEELRTDRDSLVVEWGAGPTHRACHSVERLVEYRFTGSRFVMTRRAPIQLQLLGDSDCRNWEGIVRLDDLGFLLVTDTYPETILAFVPAAGEASSSCGPPGTNGAPAPGGVQAERDAAAGAEGPLPEPATTGTAASSDGVPIHWESYGRGSPALVLVHCWGCDSGFWARQIVPLAQKHQVVTLDLGGHGRSGSGRREWTIPAFGADVAAVVRALGLERVILVGHSIGGTVAIAAARLLPERIAGLIAVDTLQDLDERHTDEQIEQFLAPLRGDFAGGTRAFIRANLFPPAADSTVVAWVLDRVGAMDPALGIGSLGYSLGYDAAAGLQEVRAPVRLLVSDMYPVNLAALSAHAPGAEVEVIEGVGHYPMLEKPEEFTRALLEIVRGLAAQKGGR